VFHDLAAEDREHLGKLEGRYRELLERDPELESRPTFLFFKGAANGLFAEGADRLLSGVNDQQALLIGIRCERNSHRFFKKYGERFEDSEGKQIFLEFADEGASIRPPCASPCPRRAGPRPEAPRAHGSAASHRASAR
jgi:rubrerythrin